MFKKKQPTKRTVLSGVNCFATGKWLIRYKPARDRWYVWSPAGLMKHGAATQPLALEWVLDRIKKETSNA